MVSVESCLTSAFVLPSHLLFYLKTNLTISVFRIQPYYLCSVCESFTSLVFKLRYKLCTDDMNCLLQLMCYGGLGHIEMQEQGLHLC